MNKLIFVIIALLLITTVRASTEEVDVEIDSEITIDWIGNDEFYIRTEDIDKKFSCDSQNDSTFDITFEREIELDSELNCTGNTKILLEGMRNLSNHCSFLEDEFNCSEELVARAAAHERTVTRYEDCKEDKGYLEDISTTGECDTKEGLCPKELYDAVFASDDQCQIDKLAWEDTSNDCTADLEEEQGKTKNIWVYVIIAAGAGAGGLYLYQDSQKKGGHQTPKQIRDDGFPDMESKR